MRHYYLQSYNQCNKKVEKIKKKLRKNHNKKKVNKKESLKKSKGIRKINSQRNKLKRKRKIKNLK